MLSTRFGYGRPAFLARALAKTFCAGDNGVDFLLGFFFSHTGLSMLFFILVYSLYACETGRISISKTQSIGIWLMSPTVSG